MRLELAAMVGTFVVTTAVAALLGAANFGTALTFGELSFAIVLMWALVRR